ncbi:MAG: hypothetical protein V1887_01525 [Candidatus Aenigmatarchaeota archaeon]
MPAKEELVRKKLKRLEELTGERQENIEHELIPLPGENITPLTTKKRKRY